MKRVGTENDIYQLRCRYEELSDRVSFLEAHTTVAVLGQVAGDERSQQLVVLNNAEAKEVDMSDAVSQAYKDREEEIKREKEYARARYREKVIDLSGKIERLKNQIEDLNVQKDKLIQELDVILCHPVM